MKWAYIEKPDGMLIAKGQFDIAKLLAKLTNHWYASITDENALYVVITVFRKRLAPPS